jgi:hypothetical protein
VGQGYGLGDNYCIIINSKVTGKRGYPSSQLIKALYRTESDVWEGLAQGNFSRGCFDVGKMSGKFRKDFHMPTQWLGTN